jgi:hypothetical protein
LGSDDGSLIARGIHRMIAVARVRPRRRAHPAHLTVIASVVRALDLMEPEAGSNA